MTSPKVNRRSRSILKVNEPVPARFGVMGEKWTALAREAGLAAEHLAIGVTALGKANYAQPAYYGQAFFALSTGFERSAKLILAVDYAVQNGGKFPATLEIERHKHNLVRLLSEADRVGERLGTHERLPDTAIHRGIIAVLSEFATNITRYYNIEVLTDSPRINGRKDPIQRWHDDVIVPVLAQYYEPHYRERDEQHARAMDALFGPISMVVHTSEDKRSLTSLYDSSLQGAKTEFATPYVRLYVMQIVRFIAEVAGELGRMAQSRRIEDVPVLSEFFATFCCSDRQLKSRKRWSIYRP